MTVKTEDVFGVSTKQVLSYIPRDQVDGAFLDALKSDKQIVVYGASKQGKTSLVSKYLPYEENIPVNVTPKTEMTDVYSSILRQLNVHLVSAGSDTTSREASTTLGLKFKALIPIFASGEAKADATLKAGKEKTSEYEEIPFNLSLPQDISELIKKTGSTKRIIIENFHYLDDEKQKQFAFDLRTFQELGIQFIILGVWREKNRLAQFNGDLLDRITEVPVEPWTEAEFLEVARKGQSELNINLSPELIKKCSDASFKSIGVFQELLKETCFMCDVREKPITTMHLTNLLAVERSTEKKASEYAARHQRALEAIAAGNVGMTARDGVQPLFLPYYLIKVILLAGYDGVANGMSRQVLHEKIQQIHHRPADVRGSDMSNLLLNLAALQNRKSISPPIIDYDNNQRQLQVVDSTFYFFLKHAELDRISEELLDPMDH